MLTLIYLFVILQVIILTLAYIFVPKIVKHYFEKKENNEQNL